KDETLRGFWTEHSTEISKKLPSLIRTDCADLGTTSSSTCSTNLMSKSNSWFQVNQQMLLAETTRKSSARTFCQWSPWCLWQDIMERDQQRIDAEENVKEPPKKKSRASAKP